ncbi:MAG: hypothetical protein FVQ78_03120 [Solirubrobacterales bacterium]|nr:hypothetical protein [Solirubrobacterales bacterium]
MAVENQGGGRLRRLLARGRGRRFDLLVGIVLGVILGIAVAYVLVIVIGGGRDASDISTPSSPPNGAETRSG